MGIFNIGNQFVDIIEWTQSDRDTMVYRYPRYKNEIKYGAKLTVREGQTAIFINEGKIADIFPPGIYELKTANLPILSTLQSWQYGFESPFKAEVYFFNTTNYLDLKWGTKQPVIIKDSKFGVIRIRAFGSYTMQIKNVDIFMRKLVGTDGNFEISEVSEQLTNALVSRFSEAIAESNISIVDLATKYSELAKSLEIIMQPVFSKYGLQVGSIYIENISLPKSIQKALDEKAGMNIIGDKIEQYTKYQAAQGIASGEGSSAISSGIGMAMGMEMAKQMSDKSNESVASQDENIDEPPLLKEFYVMVKGERKGPFAIDKIYKLLIDEEIDTDSFIWKKGMKEWKPIKESRHIDLSLIPPKI